ncbi:hypothetical protein GCM10027162_47910 [Streptomyces incanus]
MHRCRRSAVAQGAGGQQTEGLYRWNQAGIARKCFDGVLRTLPVAVVGLAGLLPVARRVDGLALGDDAARGLGVPVRATRVTAVVPARLLSVAAVTLAGPAGFVGLMAPHAARALGGRRHPGPSRSRCCSAPYRCAPPGCWVAP